jgi:glycosyltransferase involved in cell wall biosynthesis
VRRFKLLAVTSELPWPLNTGGHLRTFHLLRALNRHYQVRLVTPVRAQEGAAVDVLRQKGITVFPVPVRRRKPWWESLRALSAACRGEPYVFYRRHDWPEVRRVLQDQLRQDPPDILYLDHLDSLVYKPAAPDCPSVIDLHNVYSMLARRASCEYASWWRRLYLRREANLLERMERQAARETTAVLSVSEEEERYFKAQGAHAVCVVPNGVDCAAYEQLPTGRDGGPPVILYLGSMSWGPNVAAVQFLAREVLPRLRARLPDACLRIVGRDPAPEVLSLKDLPGVQVTGSVPDVVPHLREAHVLAVPLESGGGTRLKILEAFAAGLPVVSTPVGCEGIRADHGEHLVVASRDKFLEGLLSVLEDAGLANRIAVQARVLARQRYDWGTVGATANAAIGVAIQARQNQVRRM